MRVLVTGATGKQGGAVARQLNQRGHQVVALVRQPDTAPARALAAVGIELSAGDLAGAEALRKAASGAAAIFGISVPFGPGSPGQEVAQGKLLADVASDLGLHLVFSSIRGADRITTSSVAHASSKQLIERYLRDRPVRATVLGPTYFMENALNVGFNRLHQGILAMPLPPGKRLDQTTVLDIAALAVYAFEHPGELAGQRIDLASTASPAPRWPAPSARSSAGPSPISSYPSTRSDTGLAATSPPCSSAWRRTRTTSTSPPSAAGSRASTGTISPAGLEPSTGSTSSARSPSPGLDGAPP
jgi:uncharacterized protein YbjT (DUF2867 family)